MLYSLTSITRLAKVPRVLGSFAKNPHPLRRLISAAVLLFVFFLPLHFHATATAQVAKECACIQGTRIQLAVSSVTWTCAPPPRSTLVVVHDDALWTDEADTLKNVRAPPALLSLLF